MEYININQDFKFETRGKNIYVYQLINDKAHYYDIINNNELLSEEQFRYRCKVW